MPSRGQSITLTYTAWDVTNNVPKTGDVGNHTLRWIKDGASAAPANAASEVDATNAPGEYSVVLTGTECTANFGKLAGKSSTSGISIMPIAVSFEQLPTAAPANNGGLATVDANNNVHGLQTLDSTAITGIANGTVTALNADTTAGGLRAQVGGMASGTIVLKAVPSNADGSAIDEIDLSELENAPANFANLVISDAGQVVSSNVTGGGDGDVLVDHNFAASHTVNGGNAVSGGQNSILITNINTGQPLGNAKIVAYRTADVIQNAGTAAAKDRTYTLDDGTWQSPMQLSSGIAYSLIVKQSDFVGSYRIDITVP